MNHAGGELKVKVAQSCLTLCYPGQNTGVGRLSLLQGIFLTQGWKPGLPHCRWILCQLSYQGSPAEESWWLSNAWKEKTSNMWRECKEPKMLLTLKKKNEYVYFRASLIAQLVKNPFATWVTWVQSLGWEDPLEKGKSTHSSSLAWRIP